MLLASSRRGVARCCLSSHLLYGGADRRRALLIGRGRIVAQAPGRTAETTGPRGAGVEPLRTPSRCRHNRHGGGRRRAAGRRRTVRGRRWPPSTASPGTCARMGAASRHFLELTPRPSSGALHEPSMSKDHLPAGAVAGSRRGRHAPFPRRWSLEIRRWLTPRGQLLLITSGHTLWRWPPAGFRALRLADFRGVPRHAATAAGVPSFRARVLLVTIEWGQRPPSTHFSCLTAAIIAVRSSRPSCSAGRDRGRHRRAARATLVAVHDPGRVRRRRRRQFRDALTWDPPVLAFAWFSELGGGDRDYFVLPLASPSLQHRPPPTTCSLGSTSHLAVALLRRCGVTVRVGRCHRHPCCGSAAGRRRAWRMMRPIECPH